jgi:flagellar biosynthesis chaperone FliJ
MHFEFRLEKALSFVQLKETTKKMEVAASLQKLHFLKGRKSSLADNIRNVLAKTYENGYFDLANAAYFTEQINLTKLENDRLERFIREEENLLKKKQQELSRLQMRKKGLESLREKRLQEFKLRESRREQKQIDDTYELIRLRKV